MYLVLSDCIAKGKNLKVGQVVELDQDTAKVLTQIGRVEKTESKPVEEVKKTTRQAKPKTKREK
jgi:hypothetical protein